MSKVKSKDVTKDENSVVVSRRDIAIVMDACIVAVSYLSNYLSVEDAKAILSAEKEKFMEQIKSK